MRSSACASILLLGALAGCAGAPRLAPEWQSVEVVAGPQDLPEKDWAPLDARVRIGVAFSGRKPEWPCGLEFGMQYARAESQDDSVVRGGDFLDLRLGAAGEWRPADWLTLAAGAGPRLGLLRVTRPGTFMEVEETSSSLGLYAHAGAFVRLAPGFSIGLDGQWTGGSDYHVLGGAQDSAATELLLALRFEY